MSIYQRIGEAVASCGQITLVIAYSKEEDCILAEAGFTLVGAVALDAEPCNVYEVPNPKKKKQIESTLLRDMQELVRAEKPQQPRAYFTEPMLCAPSTTYFNEVDAFNNAFSDEQASRRAKASRFQQ